jgi:8-oxo-dGTP pyrophosphatase MutT (NUDIX family)
MITRKTAAYIFRREKQQNELLVFAHRDFPDVPIQVPGGTVDEGEEEVDALFREVKEEAGLVNLVLVRKLGTHQFYWREINGEVERHFFLLEAPTEVADEWEHEVFGNGIDSGLVFSFCWIKVTDDLELAGDLGKFLSRESTPELYV